VAHQIVDGNLLDYALGVYDEQAAQGNAGLLQQHSIAGSNGLRQQQQLLLQQQHTGKVKAQHTMTQRNSSLLKKHPIAANNGLRSSSSSRKGHSTAQHDTEQYQPCQATLIANSNGLWTAAHMDTRITTGTRSLWHSTAQCINCVTREHHSKQAVLWHRSVSLPDVAAKKCKLPLLQSAAIGFTLERQVNAVSACKFHLHLNCPPSFCWSVQMHHSVE
jgi:hypothetical protein